MRVCRLPTDRRFLVWEIEDVRGLKPCHDHDHDHDHDLYGDINNGNFTKQRCKGRKETSRHERKQMYQQQRQQFHLSSGTIVGKCVIKKNKSSNIRMEIDTLSLDMTLGFFKEILRLQGCF